MRWPMAKVIVCTTISAAIDAPETTAKSTIMARLG
jgi:hypothetical protein